MSFSARVKEELSHQLSKARHCQIAELAAILSLCGKIHIDEEDHFSIRIHTENVAVARKYFTLLKNTFNIKADISIRRNAFLKKSRSYTEKGRAELKKQAEASQKNRNPYSWIFKVEDGKTINQYTATFYTCGICHLMEKLGLREYIPAMCTLDYDMAELNHTRFTRSCTLANGDNYCDCHYDHIG